MSHQMLLTELYPDRLLLPWQQNLRQNGLYLNLYNKYHQHFMTVGKYFISIIQLFYFNANVFNFLRFYLSH